MFFVLQEEKNHGCKTMSPFKRKMGNYKLFRQLLFVKSYLNLRAPKVADAKYLVQYTLCLCTGWLHLFTLRLFKSGSCILWIKDSYFHRFDHKKLLLIRMNRKLTKVRIWLSGVWERGFAQIPMWTFIRYAVCNTQFPLYSIYP